MTDVVTNMCLGMAYTSVRGQYADQRSAPRAMLTGHHTSFQAAASTATMPAPRTPWGATTADTRSADRVARIRRTIADSRNALYRPETRRIPWVAVRVSRR